MGINVCVSSSDTWDFFQENQLKMKTLNMTIASNDATDCHICLTSENGKPVYTVFRGDDKVYEEEVITKADCINTVKRLYCMYLFPVLADCTEYGDCDAHQDLNDQIYEREDALMNAAIDFLQVLLCCPDYETLVSTYGEEIIEVFIDDMCRYLAQEHQISVYRPMWVIDDDGTEEFCESPYLDLLDDANVDDDIPLANT